MTTAHTEHETALRLLEHILAHYESLDAFLRQIHRELDEPTLVLPLPAHLDCELTGPIAMTAAADTGRHARAGH
ncbi:hypothetical protein [Nocardia sp. NPDC057668]|uniref:hypothetical protein n=1 Tax=Nocardia sp. NPDC057668 TaxID=3346202 RepID=UPI00366FD082